MDEPVVKVEREEVRFQPGCFPYGFKKECKALWHLAWPLLGTVATRQVLKTSLDQEIAITCIQSLSILFHYLIQPISLAFCGHLGKKQLASVALALSVIYITTVSFGRGLAFGGDTYFSQCYGSANKKKMGIYLQKGLLFGVLTAMVVWAILLNVHTLLMLAGQDPVVSRLTQEYVLYFFPGVLAYCWLFILMRYLLCQNRVMPNFIICVIACGANALLHYLLLYQAGMGIRGSAISLAVSYYLVFFMFMAYIFGSDVAKETWGGWSWECLEDWGPFGKTVVSSIVMTFLFWLCTEVGTFLGGILGEKELSAYSIMFQVEGFMWTIPLGLGGACTARVGQYLGSNEPLGAKTATRTAFTIQGFISIAMAAIAWGLKDYIPRFFTPDEEIIKYTSGLFPILALWLALEGIGGMGVSVARGTGRQTLCAVIIMVSYYVVALPVGTPLMFMTSLGLAGLWWGYILGISLQDAGLLVFVALINWEKEAEMAQIRAGVTGEGEDGVPDETTSLLGNRDHEAVNHAVQNGNYVDYDPDVQRQRRIKLVFKRLLVLLFFVAILAVGVLCHLFIHIEPKPTDWESLCIPRNESDIVTTPLDDTLFVKSTMSLDGAVSSYPGELTTESWENVTLPFCGNFSEWTFGSPTLMAIWVPS